MSRSENDRTYRVSGLPGGVSFEDSESILRDFFSTDGYVTEPIVHSLGLDPYAFGRHVDMVATVTFLPTPPTLLGKTNYHFKMRTTYQNVNVQLSLTIDTHFLGFTPLNAIKDDEAHKIE